ncbi:hypothetical protein [Symmachiella macrocystis]|nr:hypothetical protein [Symmachiella macrocystis]
MIILSTLILVPLVCIRGVADEAPPEEKVTLLGMLLEWQYPESKFNGAEGSGAAIQGVTAIKSKAILTTPDSAEKVMDFYRKKLNVDAEGNNLGGKKGEQVKTERSILIQDVSDDRPSKLYVIAINEAKSSTTLVVSRVDGEDVTRIAWSNYREI